MEANIVCENNMQQNLVSVQHIFIIGSKSIGQYGGYETFVDKLTEQHASDPMIQYYIVTKANGDGHMDETKLANITPVDDHTFLYHNAKVIKLQVPQIGSAQAIVYDVKAMNFCLSYIVNHHIVSPIIYVLACRIGLFFGRLVSRAHKLGCLVYVNPDGHEWKRAKWSAPVRKYWKESEKLMVKYADLLVCDSINIEKYIKEEYSIYSPRTVYIAYGADVAKSKLSDNDPKFVKWLESNRIESKQYYMCCGRFVPENSYEAMIREFMKSGSDKDFAIITTENGKFYRELEQKLGFKRDKRIKFVGTVYDQELLKKIRENAYGYFHGHTVGGTNPSLIEALGSTDLNLLVDVGFNWEVAEDGALYWGTQDGELAALIDKADRMSDEEIEALGRRAKDRVRAEYTWEKIVGKYEKLWLERGACSCR